MNPNACRVVLRARDPFEVFDLTLRLARERWRTFAALLGWTVAPWVVVAAVVAWFTDGHWALLLLPLVLATPIQAPFTLAAGRLLFTEELSQREVLGALWERLGTLVGTWFLGMGAWLASSLTCGLALPPVLAWLCYLTETALLERVSLSRCLRRSMRLSGAHMGIAFAAAGSRFFFTAWFALLGELTGHAVVNWVLQLGEPFGSMWEGQVTPYLVAGILLAQPVHAVYRLLLYVDIRTRVEGWDLQVALRAVNLEATS